MIDNEEDANVYVRWVRDYGAHTLGRAIHQTLIHVSLGGTNCNNEWQAFDRNTVVKILWHELGHTLGFGHSDDPDNIMYPTTRRRFASEYDVSWSTLTAGAYEAFPICASGEYRLSFEVHGDDSLTLAVLPSLIFAEWSLSGDGGSDHDCRRRERQKVNITCRIEAGESVFVYNANDVDSLFGIPLGSINFSGTITLLDEPPWPDMEWDEDAFYYDDETLDYYRELFAEE